jgi:hypothetical protein
MTDWKTRLRDSDPARHAEMSAADVQRIRSIVLSAAHAVDPSIEFAWPRAFVVTTAALTITCAAALVTLQQHVGEMRREAAMIANDRSASDGGSEPDRVVQKQQLQFATPGGTRIIWVFDSEFDIKGTLP